MRISDWSSDVCSSDLLAVGLLCVARDRDFAQIGARRGPAEYRSHHLPRRRTGFGMGDGGDDLEILFAAADLRRAEMKIGAFVQDHIEFDAAIRPEIGRAHV